MLPKPGPLDPVPVRPRMRSVSNFATELAPWFRLPDRTATLLARTAGVEPAWPDEPPSARIPFLIF